MFHWDKHSVEIAYVLANAGFSAREAAAVIGTSRASVLGRSSRMREFQFAGSSPRVSIPDSVFEARVAEARELVKDIVPPAEPRPPLERIPRRTIMARNSNRKNQPLLHRTDANVEAPLTEAEKNMLFSNEGVGESSINFANLKDRHCKWVVSDIDGLDTMYCGKKRVEGSSYCQRHRDLSVSKRQPKRLNLAAASKLDQNIVHVAPGKGMNSSVLKKN